ncbi:hypothetical protein SDC9_116819 [bioreactor metagenome]|uniref:HIRAN domain-containing protein n=1 Tax=bioreactor metagenome TaxID=1076179 RepID=A0A645BYY2_9ZZZZ
MRCLAFYRFSKIKGVSLPNRQALIRKLASCNPNEIALCFIREPNNNFDPNAIQIAAIINHDNPIHIGYVDKSLAANISPMLDSGKESIVILECFTGLHYTNSNIGINYKYVII